MFRQFSMLVEPLGRQFFECLEFACVGVSHRKSASTSMEIAFDDYLIFPILSKFLLREDHCRCGTQIDESVEDSGDAGDDTYLTTDISCDFRFLP